MKQDADAMTHQAYLDRNTKLWKTQFIAERWGCSRATVCAVPRDRLPYINIGRGLHRESRRYQPTDVMAYELSLLEKSA